MDEQLVKLKQQKNSEMAESNLLDQVKLLQNQRLNELKKTIQPKIEELVAQYSSKSNILGHAYKLRLL